MKPITRKEMLMAKAAGQTVPDIEPITREEYFLNQIAESGGGGGGGCTKVYPAEAVTTDGGQVPEFVDNVSYNTLKADTDNGVLPVLLYTYIDTEQEQTTTTVATLTRLILYDDGACEATFTDGLFFVAYDPTEKLTVRS